MFSFHREENEDEALRVLNDLYLVQTVRWLRAGSWFFYLQGNGLKGLSVCCIRVFLNSERSACPEDIMETIAAHFQSPLTVSGPVANSQGL